MSKSCGSNFLVVLPDDVLVFICRSLSPTDICNFSLCCKSLCALAASEKIWFAQCENVGILPHKEIVEWRKGVSSYKALCRFLLTVKPLIGIWVHQNPELGNVVYVMPGFLSAVGCRIIPQEVSPLGIQEGPILWAPVFEVIGGFDGSIIFFLHGREKGHDCLYPGSVKAIERNCNVLLLEVEPIQQKDGVKLLYSKSCSPCPDKEAFRKVSRWNKGSSISQGDLAHDVVPFSRLGFSNRRKLLDRVTSQVCLQLPDSICEPLFPRLSDDNEKFKKDALALLERRSVIQDLVKFGGRWTDQKLDFELNQDRTQLGLRDTRQNLDRGSGYTNFCNKSDDNQIKRSKRKILVGYFRNSLKTIFGRSISCNRNRVASKSTSSSSEIRQAQLHKFLNSGDTIGLSLHASTMKLSSYRAWPSMHESQFALYKLPVRVPKEDNEYAGLWGGTFGWPPGKPTEDKPSKALFLLLLSYEEIQGERLLIATKILEGTHYVLHPNGSAMFVVNIDEPSAEPFPWDTDEDSNPVIVDCALMGEGIANGYGFRYPGSKPGSLFVIGNSLLAFIWKESRSVLTLQRLDLEKLLKKGEKVPPLPPVLNFSYLTKSYSNVFNGFSNSLMFPSTPSSSHAS